MKEDEEELKVEIKAHTSRLKIQRRGLKMLQ